MTPESPSAWLRNLFSPAAILAGAVIVALLVAGFVIDMPVLRDGWRFAGATLAVCVLVWHFGDEYRTNWSTSRIVLGALAGFVAGADLQAAYAAWWNHMNMQEYDFFALYMDARVAFEGLDFYEPANYQSVYNAMATPFSELNPGFQRNVLETGTKYPPPTLLYLWPFGALERLPAHIAWVVVSWVFIAICIFIFWRHVLLSRSLTALLAVVALVLCYPGTKLTLSLEQMHFTALALALLAYAQRHQPLSGLWIGLGTLIKPPVALIAFYSLRARNWPGIATLILGAIILCGISVIVFGWDVFARFFTDNPNLRVSEGLYSEDMNRSILGTAIRNFGWDFSQGSPMGHPWFVIPAAIISLITLVASWRSGPRDRRVFALILCLGLLIYPGLQRHYSVLLLLPLLILMTCAWDAGWPRWLIALVTTCVVVFSTSQTLACVIAVWVGLLVVIMTDADDAPDVPDRRET